MTKQKLEEMDQELLQKIREGSIKQWGDDSSIKDAACLMESLTEADCVYSEVIDELRWYEVVLNVVQLGDCFFGYEGYHMTGDACMRDQDLEYDITEIQEMEPKEVVKTIYVPKQ